MLWTSAVAALFSALFLKFLHIFHFIGWSPTGWTNSLILFTGRPWYVSWVTLYIVLLLFYILVYLIFSAAASVPPSVLSILSAAAVVCAAEWAISPPTGVKEAVSTVSIPLLTLAAIIMRFVSGTAVFMRTEVDREAK